MKSQFKPMLASPLDEKYIELQLKQTPLLGSAKLDGIRSITLQGRVCGRSLKAIPNKHVQSLFQDFEYYDGELVVGKPNSSSVYHDTFSGVMSIEGTPEVALYVFDHTENCGNKYSERFSSLKIQENVVILAQTELRTLTDVLEFESKLLEDGYEGAMLRRADAVYKFGRATPRSLDLMKIKRDSDREALIVDIYPAYENQNETFTDELGRTARTSHQENLVEKDLAGGFVLNLNGITFKCSMGKFNHAQRKDILINKSLHIGKLLKFRSFEYGMMTNGSPRFPRALGFRSEIDTD